MFRDVLPKNPDMIISYSGVNDTKISRGRLCEGYPYSHKNQSEFLNFTMKYALKRGFFYGKSFYESVDGWTMGLPDYEDESNIWVRNERMMHALCEEFGIRFYAFLQPVRDYGGYISGGEPEETKYIEETKTWYNKTRSLIADKEYITDLSGLFNGQKNIYYDRCHVFETGNKQIASAIFKHIIKDIRADIKEKGGKE
jgi:hypothetical protein